MENNEENKLRSENQENEAAASYIDVQNSNRMGGADDASEEKAGPDGLQKDMDGSSKAADRDRVAIDLGLKDGDLDNGLSDEDREDRDNSMI